MRKLFYIKKSDKDLFKDLTLCRNCGREVFYGDLIFNTGHSACPECYESLRLNIMKIRETDYDEYRTLDHLYLLPDHVYNKLVEYYKIKYLKEVTHG